MGDANPICTLGYYSKSSHVGYKNTIELPEGNNVVPLRSDTIRWCKTDAHSTDFASNWLERLPAGSITTWEDLTTLPHRGIDRWLLIQIFYDHVSFHLKCEIDRAAGDKLCDKNVDESWEIIENFALYDHERWNDSKDFVKQVKAISTSQSTLKTPDQKLLELEDQINFLLNGSRLTPRPSSTQVPQAYAKAVYSNPRMQNKNEPPKQNPFTFRERSGPNPQP
ncbi:hypothetical protein Tco_0805018 [Tanacetum coccineum]